MSKFKSAELYYQKGGSDKVYNASIEGSAKSGMYDVNIAYGRRGSPLNEYTMFTGSIEQCEKNFNKQINAKVKKGYSYKLEESEI